MVKKIPLTQGKYAIVDDEDYKWLSRWKWHAQKKKVKYKNLYYAVRHTFKDEIFKTPHISMHQLILNPPKGTVCDHIDGDGLNNQRNNLRIVTQRENCQNRHDKRTSQYPGVSKYGDKWIVHVGMKKRQKHIGYFNSEQEAVKAYQKAIIEIDNGVSFEDLTTYNTTSSKYKGVSWHKSHNKWRTYIKHNGKQKFLGYFDDEYKAHLAVQNAMERFGCQ